MESPVHESIDGNGPRATFCDRAGVSIVELYAHYGPRCTLGCATAHARHSEGDGLPTHLQTAATEISERWLSGHKPQAEDSAHRLQLGCCVHIFATNAVRGCADTYTPQPEQPGCSTQLRNACLASCGLCTWGDPTDRQLCCVQLKYHLRFLSRLRRLPQLPACLTSMLLLFAARQHVSSPGRENAIWVGNF